MIFQEALINAMNDELPRIQEQVYYGLISSHTDILDKFLTESGIKRYNPQVQLRLQSVDSICFKVHMEPANLQIWTISVLY